MDLSWDDLRSLEAPERTVKPGQAARELGISLSMLYRRIAELEQSVGRLCLKRSWWS